MSASARRTPLQVVERRRAALSRSRRAARAGDYLFVVPAVLFVALIMLYPLAYNVELSVRDVNLGTIVRGGAEFVGLENYRAVFADPALWHALGISLLYTGGSLAVAFVIGFALALLFARAFPASGTLRAILLLAWVLPTVVTGTVWRWMLDGESGVVNHALERLGLLGKPVFWLTEPGTALPGVIAGTVWVLAPFVMVLLMAGLQGISPSLYEAAEVDGANAWRRFLHITLPLMRPVILTVLLLSFIFTFKTFDNVYVMTRGGPGDATKILPIQAYESAFSFFRFSEGAVSTTVLLLISVLLAAVYFVLSRREETA
jgi:multiple sugar transport system permease protein